MKRYLEASPAYLAAAIVFGSLLAVPAAAQSIGDTIGSWFGRGPAAPAAPGPAAGPNAGQEIECPDVGIRQGASTLAISAPGAEATPMSTRYQVSIGQTARECAALGGVMTIKVGVQGRVLLGPAGGPGRVDVPIRMAVVQEGTTPRVIVSKFYRIAVDVPPGQVAVPFVHVEQDLTFPMPPPAMLDSYIVYVGFDPSGPPAKPERKQKKKQ